MPRKAAQTAYGPMATVAFEQNEPPERRLVFDDLAYRFLPLWLKAIVSLAHWPALYARLFKILDRNSPGVWAGVLCRKRYIDDRLADAIHTDFQAIVILGAGMDTRAYRPALTGGLPVLEVDLPENITFKRRRLEAVFGSVPGNVTLAPLDFDSQDLNAVMEANGFQPSLRTFFVWEGVTQYLSEAGVKKTFDFLSQAARGSRLVFTYVLKDFIEGRDPHGLEAMFQAYRVKSSLWQLGMEPEQVPAFLEGFGWRQIEQAGRREYQERYLIPTGRLIPVLEIERAVFAEKV